MKASTWTCRSCVQRTGNEYTHCGHCGRPRRQPRPVPLAATSPDGNKGGTGPISGVILVPPSGEELNAAKTRLKSAMDAVFYNATDGHYIPAPTILEEYMEALVEAQEVLFRLNLAAYLAGVKA